MKLESGKIIAAWFTDDSKMIGQNDFAPFFLPFPFTVTFFLFSSYAGFRKTRASLFWKKNNFRASLAGSPPKVFALFFFT